MYMGSNSTHENKITLHVLIEGGRSFSDSFVVKQKLQVVIEKAMEGLGLNDADKRQLTRGDGSQLTDFKLTLEEAGLRDGETLRFLLKAAPKPDGPKKFA